MKKEQVKVGETYELRGNLVACTRIENGCVYVADATFTDEGEFSGYDSTTENWLTDSEIKHLV
jgi:hypothetical protein